MDLPSGVFLSLAQQETTLDEQAADPDEKEAASDNAKAAPDEQETDLSKGSSAAARGERGETTESIYHRLETLTGEDHDTFWERHFEQTGDQYQDAAGTFGRLLREASADDRHDKIGRAHV